MASLRDGPSVDLTIVVPYFNTGDRTRRTVDGLVRALEGAGTTFEVIAVSDGSTDGSDQLIAPVEGVVRTIRFDHNRGKGAALRAGFEIGRGRYLGFIDGDGDLPAEQIAAFAAFAGDPALRSPDMVLGSKLHPASRVDNPLRRRMYSWAWRQLVRLFFGLDVRDTQTGLKLIRRDVLADVLPRTIERRFVFDLELLAVAHHLGHRRFVEVPVRIRKGVATSVSPKVACGMLVDLVTVFVRLRVLRAYDSDRSVGGTGREAAEDCARPRAPGRSPADDRANNAAGAENGHQTDRVR